jgi:hypothetical protein
MVLSTQGFNNFSSSLHNFSDAVDIDKSKIIITDLCGSYKQAIIFFET